MLDQSPRGSPARPSHQSSTAPADNVSSTGAGRRTSAGNPVQLEVNNDIRLDATSGGQRVSVSSEFRSPASSQEPEVFVNDVNFQHRSGGSSDAPTNNANPTSQEQPSTEADLSNVSTASFSGFYFIRHSFVSQIPFNCGVYMNVVVTNAVSLFNKYT